MTQARIPGPLGESFDVGSDNCQATNTALVFTAVCNVLFGGPEPK